MNPVGLDQLAQFLGPGVGGQWMGEREALTQEAGALANQKTMSDILTAQQNRDHASQKLPVELDQMRAQTGLFGAQTGEANQRIETSKAKLKRENYDEFLDGLSKMDPQMVRMEDRAGYLKELSQRTGIPVDHPMYKIALQMHTQGQQNPQVWNTFREAFKVNPETRYKEEQATGRENIQQTGATGRTQMQTASAERINQAQIDAGKYNKAARQLSRDQAIDIAKTAVEKHAKLIDAATAARQEGDDASYQNYMARAKAIEPQARAELQARQDPSRINTPAVAGLPGNPPVQITPPGQAPGMPPAPGAGPASGAPIRWGRGPDGKPVRIQ